MRFSADYTIRKTPLTPRGQETAPLSAQLEYLKDLLCPSLTNYKKKKTNTGACVGRV